MRFDRPGGSRSGDEDGSATSPIHPTREYRQDPSVDQIALPSSLARTGIVLRSRFLRDCDPAVSDVATQPGFPRHASVIRQREFTAGRICAAEAMRDLGSMPYPVGVAQDRSPIWPAGLLGSISHTSELAAAVVARSAPQIRAVGLDLEQAVALEDDLFEEICIPREREWLATQPKQRRGLLAKAVFCAKEAAYKCQYSITGEMFGFEIFETALFLDRGSFSAKFLTRTGCFARGDRLDGHIWIAADHFVALVTAAGMSAMAAA
jgi:4'-phosphopantetheinyl transferase EntD